MSSEEFNVPLRCLNSEECLVIDNNDDDSDAEDY